VEKKKFRSRKKERFQKKGECKATAAMGENTRKNVTEKSQFSMRPGAKVGDRGAGSQNTSQR